MGGKLGKLRFVSKPVVELKSAEYSLIKAVWTRIEFEPKLHGTGFPLKMIPKIAIFSHRRRFFAKYPQYIKYFLTDPIKDDVNPDALMAVKFTVIIEVLGYLVLDFYKKPKRFNQLIGYIGMIHKDMNLDADDINVRLTIPKKNN
ncbi:uncharacterized protein LOC125500181 [Athalia rosae]|uniref:uncharacterized protein LOC125500181 n=1 Tax=Athalia rosae TaxID=37344 RepID=UPI002033A0B9|nr:uncharacterized protein LOC125500181 [Athalia rosae]